jgi:hypothetical protein
MVSPVNERRPTYRELADFVRMVAGLIVPRDGTTSADAVREIRDKARELNAREALGRRE